MQSPNITNETISSLQKESDDSGLSAEDIYAVMAAVGTVAALSASCLFFRFLAYRKKRRDRTATPTLSEDNHRPSEIEMSEMDEHESLLDGTASSLSGL
jgi:hypothetical protein